MKYVYEIPEIDPHDCPHTRQDVSKIQEIFEDRGHEVSFTHAHAAWEEHSGEQCAQWLGLCDSDAKIFNIVSRRLTRTS